VSNKFLHPLKPSCFGSVLSVISQTGETQYLIMIKLLVSIDAAVLSITFDQISRLIDHFLLAQRAA